MTRTRDSDFIEVLDSVGFMKFGEEHMATPGPKSGLSARLLSDLDPSEVRLDKMGHVSIYFML